MSMNKHRTPSKIYQLCMFQRIQGQVIQLCNVESWFFTTRKREAQTMANRYNRERGFVKKGQLSCDIDKWVQPVII